MIDESLILTDNAGAGFISVASADGLDLTSIPGVVAWLHVSDAIHVGGALHESLSIRFRPVTAITPTTSDVLMKIQVCPVSGYQDAVTLVTNVVTGAIIPLATVETSTVVLNNSLASDIYIPLRNLPLTSDYIELLIWTYPVPASSPAEGIDAGRVTAVLGPLDDNASYPMPNGI